MTLADAADEIGVDTSRLSRWETGKAFPGALSMRRLERWSQRLAVERTLPPDRQLDLERLARAMERKAGRGKR